MNITLHYLSVLSSINNNNNNNLEIDIIESILFDRGFEDGFDPIQKEVFN